MNHMGRWVKVQSLKNQSLIADKCYVAEHFFDRLKGLIGKREFASGEGLFFPKCNNVHMWFMKFSIDIVFLHRDQSREKGLGWKVTSVRENVSPWTWHPLMEWRASETLELPAGTIQKQSISIGDELCIS